MLLYSPPLEIAKNVPHILRTKIRAIIPGGTEKSLSIYKDKKRCKISGGDKYIFVCT